MMNAKMIFHFLAWLTSNPEWTSVFVFKKNGFNNRVKHIRRGIGRIYFFTYPEMESSANLNFHVLTARWKFAKNHFCIINLLQTANGVFMMLRPFVRVGLNVSTAQNSFFIVLLLAHSHCTCFEHFLTAFARNQRLRFKLIALMKNRAAQNLLIRTHLKWLRNVRKRE